MGADTSTQMQGDGLSAAAVTKKDQRLEARRVGESKENAQYVDARWEYDLSNDAGGGPESYWTSFVLSGSQEDVDWLDGLPEGTEFPIIYKGKPHRLRVQRIGRGAGATGGQTSATPSLSPRVAPPDLTTLTPSVPQRLIQQAPMDSRRTPAPLPPRVIYPTYTPDTFTRMLDSPLVTDTAKQIGGQIPFPARSEPSQGVSGFARNLGLGVGEFAGLVRQGGEFLIRPWHWLQSDEEERNRIDSGVSASLDNWGNALQTTASQFVKDWQAQRAQRAEALHHFERWRTIVNRSPSEITPAMQMERVALAKRLEDLKFVNPYTGELFSPSNPEGSPHELYEDVTELWRKTHKPVGKYLYKNPAETASLMMGTLGTAAKGVSTVAAANRMQGVTRAAAGVARAAGEAGRVADVLSGDPFAMATHTPGRGSSAIRSGKVAQANHGRRAYTFYPAGQKLRPGSVAPAPRGATRAAGTASKYAAQTFIGLHSRERLRDALIQAFDYKPHLAEFVSVRYESIARAWAARKNANLPEGAHRVTTADWYRTHIAGITRGGDSFAREFAQELGGTGSERGATYGARQYTKRREDGRQVVAALSSPDGTTALHELAHVFRQQIEGEDLALLERWVGVRNGHWDVNADERFARAYEHWLRTGQAPSGRVGEVFARFRVFMERIAGVVRRGSGRHGDTPFSPEVTEMLRRYHADVSDLPGAHSRYPGGATLRLRRQGRPSLQPGNHPQRQRALFQPGESNSKVPQRPKKSEEELGELIEPEGPILDASRDEVYDLMRGKTDKADEILAAIEQGRIFVEREKNKKALDLAYERIFKTRMPKEDVAFHYGRGAWIMAGTRDIDAHIIHEGEHALNFLENDPNDGMSFFETEWNAHKAELEYRRATHERHPKRSLDVINSDEFDSFRREYIRQVKENFPERVLNAQDIEDGALRLMIKKFYPHYPQKAFLGHRR